MYTDTERGVEREEEEEEEEEGRGGEEQSKETEHTYMWEQVPWEGPV